MADPDVTKKAQPEANYKETVESILVAFILAFIFRAFVVEAFVIPTGSMATTLYGAHSRFHCPDCGYTFDVGYHGRDSANGDDVDIPPEEPRSLDVSCPNCGNVIGPRVDPVRFGDRILVLKYLYLFQKPVRWDVVVFKSPSEGSRHVPEDPEYAQNFIKRLIGNPGESIVILDGDIYVGDRNASGPQDKWTIQRKPPYVQDALWRCVYDNDFPAQNSLARSSSSSSPPWTQPWQPATGNGWTLMHGAAPSRVFEFNNPQGDGTLFFNPSANPSLNNLRDWLAYDQLDQRMQYNWVADLKVSCLYTRQSGAGPLRLQLTKSDTCFTAEFAAGKVSLFRSRVASPSEADTGKGFEPGTLEPIASADLSAIPDGSPIRIDFSNVDYRVGVRVNGREVLAREYDPDVASLWRDALHSFNNEARFARPEVRITADRQACRIEHLSLSRDIYYGNSVPQHVTFWAGPEKPVHLGPDEYFVLGDNSQISGDARYWSDPVRLPHENLPFVEAGRVPERFMLGKAFFVYWPAGFRMPFLPVNAVPDFGEMRFIQ